jgi:hypothetical protein
VAACIGLHELACPTRFEGVPLPSEGNGRAMRPVVERRSRSIARIGCRGPPQPSRFACPAFEEQPARWALLFVCSTATTLPLLTGLFSAVSCRRASSREPNARCRRSGWPSPRPPPRLAFDAFIESYTPEYEKAADCNQLPKLALGVTCNDGIEVIAKQADRQPKTAAA